MEYREEDWLQLSGLQHFAFCRRQWALIHMESQWAENFRTVDGQLMHQHVHDQQARESRGSLLIVRGLAVHSARLGISGQCDAVEFHRVPEGIPLEGREGLWLPYPVEYKRGKPKEYRPTSGSFAPRPSAWRRCFAVGSQKGPCTTASPTAGQSSPFLRSFGNRQRPPWRRCTGYSKESTPPG